VAGSSGVPGHVSGGEVFPEQTGGDARDQRHFPHGDGRLAQLEQELLHQALAVQGLRTTTAGKRARERERETDRQIDRYRESK